ncbi:MAG TPA: right-handed parallel beta-helix repeat-containing protein [Xanthobacteraceae bacterium]|nr:right-handed parallel beta-helix repeat-containing protein [Xanthobacteraceae bacterium]
MSNILKLVAAAAAILTLSQVSSHAQATRTWVTGAGGSDANPCSRTAPCQTFAGAITKTAINGIIDCIDSGAYGAVTITKSITIDCHENFAGILASGTTGIVINIAAGNANDPLRSVRIRNLIIDGTGSSGTVGTRTGIRGIRIDNANSVFIEDTMIRNFTQQGILDQRTTGGDLFINNTTVQHNAGAGITIAPSSGAVKIEASLLNVISERNAEGLRVGSGARVMVKRSIFSGNTNGVVSEGPAGVSRVSVDDSSISGNTTGAVRLGGGAIRFSNTDFAHNATARTGANLFSFGNNRLTDNISDGDAFTPQAQE